MKKLLQLEKEKLMLLEKEKSLRDGLPHIYGFPWYKWAWEFHESTNRYNFLTAANQVSKSSTQIRKCINWSTDQKKWPELWSQRPNQFWYFYPSKDIASEEFETKWSQFLPANGYKKSHVYGWDFEKKQKQIYSITFNSGMHIFFKTYEQDVSNLQTATVHAAFLDEEAPELIFNEVRTRLTSTHGYLHAVFTATIGQDFWRRIMEPANKEEELFKTAFKRQVSLYDCLTYMDGSPSHWTLDRIKEIEAACGTQAEIDKRVYGKFVLSGGLKFESFDRDRNTMPAFEIPNDWQIYTGVDVGSGGEGGHPAAICFLAVASDCKTAVVFKGWRGDGLQTDSSDILKKYIEMLDVEKILVGQPVKIQMKPVIQSYDSQSRDFFLVSNKTSMAFTPADKKQDSGYLLLNTLFKLGMVKIFDNDPELSKLVIELTSLKANANKSKAVDDFCDALRFCVMSVPWDFSGSGIEVIKTALEGNRVETDEQRELNERRGIFTRQETGEAEEDLFGEWQDLIDGG